MREVIDGFDGKPTFQGSGSANEIGAPSPRRCRLMVGRQERDEAAKYRKYATHSHMIIRTPPGPSIVSPTVTSKKRGATMRTPSGSIGSPSFVDVTTQVS